jgi:hypothetical protein
MDATHRQALLFVWFTAGCLMVVGLLDTGLYVAQHLPPKQPAPVVQSGNSAPVNQSNDAASAVEPRHSTPMKVLPIALNSIPFVIGVVGLVRAKAVANWISDKLE